MRYPLIIFDFDGTLADSFPFFVATHNLLARRHGFAEVAEAEVDGLRALPTRALLARSGLPAWRLPWVARDFVRAMAAAPSIPLFGGIPEVLRTLHAAGITLASSVRGSGMELPFIDEAFDITYSSNVAEHVPEEKLSRPRISLAGFWGCIARTTRK